MQHCDCDCGCDSQADHVDVNIDGVILNNLMIRGAISLVNSVHDHRTCRIPARKIPASCEKDDVVIYAMQCDSDVISEYFRGF